MSRIIVIGAGVAGLLSAHRLHTAGHDVLVVEADTRIGGQLYTTTLDGLTVDIGAEAVHLGAPHLKALVDELGLAESSVASNTGTTMIGLNKNLRPMPAGVGPMGPTKLLPVIRSGILSPAGLARAGREPFKAKPVPEGMDVSVGAFLTQRFGREVVDRLVAPLLGSLHSGDVHRLSLRSVAPQLLPTARSGQSLLRRRPTSGTVGGGAAFASWPGGMATLVDRLAEGLDIRTSTAVTALSSTGHGWRVHLGDQVEEADGLVVAIGSRAAATLLDPLVPGVGGPLRAGRVASVANVIAHYPQGSLPDSLQRVNGILMTPDSPQLLKAATILSNKWPHTTPDGSVLVRMSAGRVGRDTVDRLNDDQLVLHLHREFSRLTGMEVEPSNSLVARWQIPQAEVGHHRRMVRARNLLTILPPLALAGCSYDGIGLASVTRSAEAAAALISSAFDH